MGFGFHAFGAMNAVTPDGPSDGDLDDNTNETSFKAQGEGVFPGIILI
jgi:hypothetical protein